MKRQTKHTVEDQPFRNIEKFQSIDVEQDWLKVRERMELKPDKDNLTIHFSPRIGKYWSAAAIVIILLSIGFLVRYTLFGSEQMLLASTGDMKAEVLLPDGSKVLLNNNSELRYPEKFNRNTRTVSFNGEAFFQVAKNPEKPFIINISDRATVEVLGTSFNINAIRDSDSVKVHVLEGRVAFFTSATRANKFILNKDEQAVLKGGEITKEQTVNSNFLSWKTGILHFEQEPLDKVIVDLGKYFNRNFSIEGEGLEELRYTSTIDNQDLESVLEEFKLVLGLEYSIEGEEVTIYRPD
jgi:ferric-dicitrate binding protein FerR (iron transport regulator)